MHVSADRNRSGVSHVALSDLDLGLGWGIFGHPWHFVTVLGQFCDIPNLADFYKAHRMPHTQPVNT